MAKLKIPFLLLFLVVCFLSCNKNVQINAKITGDFLAEYVVIGDWEKTAGKTEAFLLKNSVL